MKNFISALLIIFILIFSGCLPDEDNNSLEGSWTCQETSKIFEKPLKGTSIYTVFIARDIVDDNIYYIDNFYQLGDGIEVRVKQSGFTLTLEKQTVDGIEFEGSGTVSQDYDFIELNYTADDGGDEIDQVKAEYSR